MSFAQLHGLTTATVYKSLVAYIHFPVFFSKMQQQQQRRIADMVVL